MNRDIIAYRKIKSIYECTEYNEMYDILFHYMETYVNDDRSSAYMFAEEASAVLGLNGHGAIISKIMKL